MRAPVDQHARRRQGVRVDGAEIGRGWPHGRRRRARPCDGRRYGHCGRGGVILVELNLDGRSPLAVFEDDHLFEVAVILQRRRERPLDGRVELLFDLLATEGEHGVRLAVLLELHRSARRRELERDEHQLEWQLHVVEAEGLAGLEFDGLLELAVFVARSLEAQRDRPGLQVFQFEWERPFFLTINEHLHLFGEGSLQREGRRGSPSNGVPRGDGRRVGRRATEGELNLELAFRGAALHLDRALTHERSGGDADLALAPIDVFHAARSEGADLLAIDEYLSGIHRLALVHDPNDERPGPGAAQPQESREGNHECRHKTKPNIRAGRRARHQRRTRGRNRWGPGRSGRAPEGRRGGGRRRGIEAHRVADFARNGRRPGDLRKSVERNRGHHADGR